MMDLSGSDAHMMDIILKVEMTTNLSKLKALVDAALTTIQPEQHWYQMKALIEVIEVMQQDLSSIRNISQGKVGRLALASLEEADEILENLNLGE